MDAIFHPNLKNDGPKQKQILINFPPGPDLHSSSRASISQEPIQLAKYLITQAPSTILVNLNYRFPPKASISNPSTSSVEAEQDYRYPRPIHDVTTAFGYIRQRFLLSQGAGRAKVNNDLRPPRIYLTGSHIGGALALMLALTEPAAVQGLCITEPMIDWISLNDLPEIASKSQTQLQTMFSPPGGSTKSRPRRKHNLTTDDPEQIAKAAQRLMSLRSKLFRKPADIFDPFASPVLFLRAPGRDTPGGNWGEYYQNVQAENSTSERTGKHENSYGPYDDDWHAVEHPDSLTEDTMYIPPTPSTSTDPSSNSNMSPIRTSSRSNAEPQKTQRRRKVLRRWPSVPYAEDIELPRTKILLPPNSTIDVNTDTEPSVEQVQDKDADREYDKAVSHILRLQSLELVDLLKRACSYGRDSQLADERVILKYLDYPPESEETEPHGDVVLQAGFREIVKMIVEAQSGN